MTDKFHVFCMWYPAKGSAEDVVEDVPRPSQHVLAAAKSLIRISPNQRDTGASPSPHRHLHPTLWLKYISFSSLVYQLHEGYQCQQRLDQ